MSATVSYAQNVPEHAQGLNEELVSVDLSDNKKQVGVYSIKKGFSNPAKLAVLLPGYPSVVRPVVENGVMTGSKLNGNFLIRARRLTTALATIKHQSSDKKMSIN